MFKRHPIFDGEGEEWFGLGWDQDGHPSEFECGSPLFPPVIGHESPFAEIVIRDFDKISSLVLDRLTTCVPDEWLAECPHAILGDVLFHPISETGLRVFLEYAFRPSLTENSYHDDAWWAIVQCPYTTGNPVTGKIDYHIIDLGWSIA